MMFYFCRVCGTPYLTQREADLCTPEWYIPERYGETLPALDVPEGWLD